MKEKSTHRTLHTKVWQEKVIYFFIVHEGIKTLSTPRKKSKKVGQAISLIPKK